MPKNTLKRNTRTLNLRALAAVRTPYVPPAARAPVRGAYMDPNVIRTYMEATTHRNAPYAPPVGATASTTPFYPNAPTAPGPGSLRSKLADPDPRHVSSAESRIVARRRRNTRRRRDIVQ
jgi:hypothetical protein